MRAIDCCSWWGVSTSATVTGGSGRRQQRQRYEVPRAPADAAVGDDLPVLGEVELTLHEPVRELAGVDLERADVAGDLLVVLEQSKVEVLGRIDERDPLAKGGEYVALISNKLKSDRRFGGNNVATSLP